MGICVILEIELCAPYLISERSPAQPSCVLIFCVRKTNHVTVHTRGTRHTTITPPFPTPNENQPLTSLPPPPSSHRRHRSPHLTLSLLFLPIVEYPPPSPNPNRRAFGSPKAKHRPTSQSAPSQAVTPKMPPLARRHSPPPRVTTNSLALF